MGFFETGYNKLNDIEVRNKAQAQQDDERRAKNQKPWRFFMKKGDEKSVLFLDDSPPIVLEHNLKINGKWNNFFTCRRVLGDGENCPLCAAGDRAYDVGFYHVLDLDGYVDKRGEKRTNVLRIFPAKQTEKLPMVKRLKKFSNQQGGLLGVKFNVERSRSDTSAAVGDDWMVDSKLDLAQVEKILGKPLKDVIPVTPADREKYWEDYLAPKTEVELQALVTTKAGAPSDEDDVDYRS